MTWKEFVSFVAFMVVSAIIAMLGLWKLGEIAWRIGRAICQSK